MTGNPAFIAASLLLAALLSGTSPAGENFTIRISGRPGETEVSLLSDGQITNLQGLFSIMHEENRLMAQISSPREGALITRGGVEAGGVLRGEISRTGDGGAEGFLRGEDVFFSVPGEGICLREGSFLAYLKDETIELESLVFNGRGALRASGGIARRRGAFYARLSMDIDDYPVFERPDRQLRVSGTAEISAGEDGIKARGDFRIERGFFFISGLDASSPPSADITVLGEEPPPEYAHPLEEAFVKIDLGSNLKIKSDELEARLEGILEIGMRAGEPVSVKGLVRAAEGSYRAYGQEMYIERGIITFTGPPDNPGLDILALHKHRRIDVGIRVFGTLADPRVELYSYPDMPDVEKLSYLILGRSFETAARGDAALIAASAAAILAPEEYARLESEIQRTTGLDEIRLAAEDDREEAVVILGKQLSSRLYLTYRKGLAGLTNAAMLEYSIAPKWILRAETGRENLVGITYSITFD